MEIALCNGRKEGRKERRKERKKGKGRRGRREEERKKGMDMYGAVVVYLWNGARDCWPVGLVFTEKLVPTYSVHFPTCQFTIMDP